MPFASHQTRKMPRGSFDQALWPLAFVVRAFKRAVCLHSHLFLGRSSLPIARRQTRKMLRGSIDQPSGHRHLLLKRFAFRILSDVVFSTIIYKDNNDNDNRTKQQQL